MRIILAPMEGVVDYTLRELLTGVGGVDQCVTEFIRVSDRLLPRAVFHRLAPELNQQGFTRAGTLVLLQLLGSDPQVVAENAALAVELGAPGIDLNFGCPAKTVNKSRGGAVLLDEPELVGDIVAAVRRAVPAHIPVSAKMRLGFRDKSRALENAWAIESAGAQSLVVHARTKEEGYRPPAHWEWIARIREAVNLPVIANGEVWTLEDYHRCREVSGCDDVMIGRGLVANPFLALEIKGDELGRDAAWAEVLWLLERFHRQVMQDLSPRHVHGRLKQWLQMLGWHFPQAKRLFPELRTEREPERLLELLCRARQQYLRDMSAADPAFELRSAPVALPA
ncbi:tRNA-dihydrouridine(16) synthase [Marinobacterium zhoushanense]|uniref:tRNA-dihydrouridine(16) synthase n=1 Tax=Marinobacterium zhoushanense TaxID=1679163 RepID=A0ABQ1KBK5_9GAMM|nr:tRNA-dihydrouridine synthase [Marinobacterium zhoushanense]GGB90501.1 tRNA-dihydrouridine(16) synthase [Marinobacterium zhoushanense]